jgi:hypothetical protein
LLPDIGLAENGKKGAGSKLLVARDGDEPSLLFIPEMDMTDVLFYRVVAEQDKCPDYVMG